MPTILLSEKNENVDGKLDVYAVVKQVDLSIRRSRVSLAHIKL